MNNISYLTQEIAEEYTRLSGIRIRSPQEYLLFREQAVKELQSGVISDIQPHQEFLGNKHETRTVNPVQNITEKKKSPSVNHSTEQTTAVANKIENNNEDNFFACIQKLED